MPNDLSFTAAARALPPAPDRVTATLHYLRRDGTRPAVDMRLDPEDRDRALAADPRPVEIRNGWLRPAADLEREGFTLVERPTALRDFDDEDAIGQVYRPEAARLIAEISGASEVHVFDHTLRRGAGERGPSGRPPVRRVHNDYTERSAPRRVRNLRPDAAGRPFAVINLWRPVSGPVLSAPLALAEAGSVPAADLIATDLVYADRVGEIFHAAWSAQHRWVYYPRMSRDEALIFKGFDSRTDGRARLSIHTAFDDPTTPADAPPRESIEIRALAFFD
ncbi:MAG: CmcJ/NvfI family oxidoreductase [Paracoccaceae bacterium]